MTPVVALLIGVIGAGLALARYLPQLVRLVRTRRTAGVSTTSLAMGAVSGGGWCAYSVLADVLSVVVTSVAAIAVCSACLAVALRLGADRVGAGPVLWAATLLLTQVAAGTTALGLVLATSAVVTGLPQLREALSRDDLTGVSLPTWALGVAEGLLWVGVGAASSDLPVLVWATGQLLVAVPVVVRVRASRRPVSAAQP